MSFENYEGSAIDTEMFQQPTADVEVQPIESTPETEDVAETVASEETEEATPETPTVEETNETNELDIPGVGRFNADEVKEWRQGYLRQSDYTKKTQELSRQRDELKTAKELYDYVNSNPNLIEALRNAEQGVSPVVNQITPEAQAIRQLAYNQKAMETDMKLSQLKAKYGNDIDEVALFNKASELKTEDLEFVYRGLIADKYMNSTNHEELIAKAKEELKAELTANKSAVNTTVTTPLSKPIQNSVNLTDTEKRIASAMGMSESEYAQWK